MRVEHSIRPGFYLQFLIVFAFFPPFLSGAETPPVSSLVLAEKARSVVAHVDHGKIDWEYELDGPLYDIQSQPNPGRVLVTGGSKKVFLLRKVWKGCRVLWDWGNLEGVDIQSAVAADWDPKDDPTLILAADVQNQRLFLAEAKSKNIKIRWEYKLPAAPRMVHLCPDSGNFLVTLKDSSVLEIFFQEDKVVWSLGKEDGLKDVRDAIRGPWAHTYVADAAGGDILCFNPQKQVSWKTHLPFAPHSCQDMSLSLLRKSGKRIVMAAVHFIGSKNVVYFLNAETGKVLSWSDRLEKGGYPDLLKAMPETPSYYKKQ